jgi:UTP--glucose-1-phosphate uridylyltransferase
MKIRKLIIPVAGMGTRFLPITKTIPKEMLPIVDKPTIQILLEEAKEAGIEEVLFITNSRKESVLNYFKEDKELEEFLIEHSKINELNEINNICNLINIKTVEQKKPLGSGDAVYQGKEFIGNEPFAVMYGDDLIKGGCALKELIEVYEKYDCNVIGVQEVSHDLTCKYGIISLQDENTLQIRGLVEKPNPEDAPSNLAGLGRYILKPEIFDELEKIKPHKNSEYQLTDAITSLMGKQAFYAAKFEGTYYDIGNKLGYLKANIAYAIDTEIKEDLKEFMNNIIKEI